MSAMAERADPNDQPRAFLVSYLRLRMWIGVLGMLLPLLMVLLGPSPTKQSISAYYYSNMRDFFVGLLSLTGAFLACYAGYKDDPPGVPILSGAMSLGVALFPTSDAEGHRSSASSGCRSPGPGVCIMHAPRRSSSCSPICRDGCSSGPISRRN